MQNINQAIKKASKKINKIKEIQIAYSNEAFELWYLLHFNYYETALSRADYKKMLSTPERLGFSYQKNNPDMYETLQNKQSIAIENANRLLKNYNPPNPGTDNPSTTVHLLVQELNRFLPPAKTG